MMSRICMLFALVLAACSGTPTVEKTPKSTQPTAAKIQPIVERKAQVPKRIILFIGDGMGMPYMTAGAYAKGAPLEMMSMPHFNLLKTHEYEFPITDSAASATAMATGVKTHYEGVSVKPGTTKEGETDPANHLKSVVTWAEEAGMRTGLVATSRIVHATPAAFAAHRAHRQSYEEIALDMSTSGVDVFMGAGSQFFDQRKDGRNLLNEMTESGYTIVRTPEELATKTKETQIVALFHDKDMPRALENSRALTLGEMLTSTISVLDRDNEKGWFLMVEGSMVDWCGHDLDAECAVAEVLDMDSAVGSALSYARDRDDTLVAVTADHETGGLTVIDPEYAGRFTKILGGEEAISKSLALADGGKSPDPIMHFGLGRGTGRVPNPSSQPGPWGMTDLADTRMTLTWGYMSLASRPLWAGPGEFYATHTLTMVPLLAEGPGAEYLTSVKDNADLGAALIALVRANNPDKPVTPSFRAANPTDTPPRNVVLMIGDGLGVNTLTAANYAHGDLSMHSLPVRGFASTHGLDCLVNDSAAGATALATGERARKRTVGMVVRDAVLEPGTSVIERAESRGYQTGIVTTTQLTHATPGAFFADVDHRRKKADIAQHFVSFRERTNLSDGIEVVVSGGAADFTAPMRAKLTQQGYTLRDSWSQAPADSNVMMWIAPQGIAPATDRLADPAKPTLAQMTQFALDQLTQDPEPFFLVVEGGQIDWRLHDAVRDQSLLDEVKDFDLAVEAVREFAEQRGDTLLIVTSDHDHTLSVLDTHYIFKSKICGAEKRCGGDFEATTIPIDSARVHRAKGFTDTPLQGEYANPELILQYAWLVDAGRQRVALDAPHSAVFVPVFAYGPWSTRLRSYIDQPEIGQLLNDWASR